MSQGHNHSKLVDLSTNDDSSPTNSSPNSTPNSTPISAPAPNPPPITTPNITVSSVAESFDESIPDSTISSKKRKLTSIVWNDFKKVTIDGMDYGICNHCTSKLKAPSRNGTSSLHEHLARCPKRKNKDIRQQVLQANLRKNDGQVEYRNFVFDQEAARDELASMIIVHEYPLSIVDHVRFRRFCNLLQPLFKVVSRNTIKSDIMKVYEYEKAKTSWLLDNLDSRIAITSDMWTCNHTKKGFMALTAHFIDDSWELQQKILRFMYVPAPHNKEVLSDVLMNSFLDWNIDRKLSTITLDNCSTNDAIVGSLLDKLNCNSLLLEGRVFHMRCCAHILNLVVKDGLEVIGDGIERIRDSVHFWTATPSRIENFEEAARQLKITCTRKLALDCKTRWNSTYLMLQVALHFKDVFPRLKQRERLYTRLPTDEDWEKGKEICEKLKLFYTSTELFSGTNYPTANCYFHKVCEIREELSTWLQSSSEIIRVMASKMMEIFLKYWDVCHVIMAVAGVLDPRYKMKLVEFHFREIYGDEDFIEIQKVRQSVYDLVCEYQSKAMSDGTTNVGVSSSKFSSLSGATNLDNTSIDKYYKYIKSSATSVHTRTELDFYLKESVLPRTDNFDVLAWWKLNGVKFPILQKIARDVLAIPVSTVASEPAFSTGGRVISPHRSRLHPSTLEALMCAQSWLMSQEDNGSPLIFEPSKINIYNDKDDDCVSEIFSQ